jgi:7-cyano-7-deazaguanine reductase
MTDAEPVLGQTVRHAVERLDVIPAGSIEHLDSVTFTTDELMSMCPVTGQPDLSSLSITYTPTGGRIIESKSLKLYLWGFRDRGLFCEEIASLVADRVAIDSGSPSVQVTVKQAVRGGIVTVATASAGTATAGTTGVDPEQG